MENLKVSQRYLKETQNNKKDVQRRETLFSLRCTVSKDTVFVGGVVLNRAEAVGKSPKSQTT